jgi:hypothetical protein
LWVFNFSLLIFFFRAKASYAPGNKYLRPTLLGWILFPLLFFSFVHYAKGYVLLILPVFILLISQRVMKLAARRPVAIALAGLNLILFFFTPFVETPVEASLPTEQRTIEERAKTTLLRAVSVGAPTLSHIRTTDRAMREALDVVRSHVPANSAVLFDLSTPYCYYARAVQIYLPQYDLIAGRRDTLYNLYWQSEVEYNIPLRQALRKGDLYYAIDRRLPTIVGEPPQSTFIANTTYLSLYKINLADTTAFVRYTARYK